MINFTPDEFSGVREGISAAHLFVQALAPVLRQRHTALNKDQRNLLEAAPEMVANAFRTVAAVTHRENRDPEAVDARPATKLHEIDTVAMRDELENVSALVMPDLTHEMVCALNELPMFNNLVSVDKVTILRAAMLMAWSFEAGRRYGLQQALAIIETTTDEYKAATLGILATALNAPLDLPTPELPFAPGSERPNDTAPSTTVANDDAHAHHAAVASGHDREAEVIPFTYPSAKDLDRVAEEQAAAKATTHDGRVKKRTVH